MYENNLYVNHYFDVLSLPKIVKEPKNPVKLSSNILPKIEFKNVSFSYPGTDNPVLKNLTFSIESNENVAIVGPNGAGKTTIVKLLCRFYDVTGGEILVNGVNIKNIKLSNWYKFLGTLFQEFMHYNFTVKENIILGRPDFYDRKLMVDAAEKSGASEFIKKLPKKYNQILGRQFEGGAELSQGQWQKLAIARAFYESAPILILDEPTSAIDAEAEYDIFNNLLKFYKDKTLFLISHRFSTVRNADKIIVLKEGEIVEIGSHQELLSNNKLYARMFKKQAIGYK
jgi:ATP-binding cassette subfamily B protein